MKLTFNSKFLLVFLFILLIEILIGKYLNDPFIRPFGGDVLVVILIYAFFKTFLQTNDQLLALSVLVFAFCIEFLQAVHYVRWLGLEHNKLMSIILGTSFSYYDLLAYAVGYLICLSLGAIAKRLAK